MRGNYLRTNQPKPETMAAIYQEIIDQFEWSCYAFTLLTMLIENFRFLVVIEKS